MGYRPDQLPRVLSESEQDDLLSEFNERYWTPHRNRTMVLAMLDAGLRVGELVALRIEHLDLPARQIKVREGKGAKDRIVPMSTRLYRALTDWLQRRPEEIEGDCELVFPTRKATSVHPNDVRRFVKREAENAGLSESERVSPHTLRHTAGTDLYKHSKDLEAVREFLGHADISTTQLYVTLANGHVEAAVDGFRAGSEPDTPTPEDVAEAAAENVPEDQREVVERAVLAAVEAAGS